MYCAYEYGFGLRTCIVPRTCRGVLYVKYRGVLYVKKKGCCLMLLSSFEPYFVYVYIHISLKRSPQPETSGPKVLVGTSFGNVGTIRT